jgi:protein tyrosine/serine phosphatase
MRPFAAVVAVAAVALAGPAVAAETANTHPSLYATPIEAAGLSNFYRVSDTLYRSAQPTAEGFRSLKRLGVATIINLRSFHSDRGRIGETRLAYEHIYMKSWHPEREDALRFLRIVADPAQQPVLVHCHHGSDRTGAMIAVYRIVMQGWSKEEAVREMTSEHFGFHRVWRNLPDWVENLDVDSLRSEAGIVPAPE